MALIIRIMRTFLMILLICFGLHFAKSFLMPITFGALLAMLLVPACSWLERKGINKAIASILCVLSFVFIIAGVVVLLSWQVAGLAQDADQITGQLNKVPERLQEYIYHTLSIPAAQQQQIIKEQNLTSKAGAEIASIANAIVSSLGSLLLIIVYVFLFLYYRKHLENFVQQFVPEGNKEKMAKIMSSSGQVAQRYISGLGMMVGILWIMYGAGFSIIGVKHALLFAVLCGILEIVPYVGNFTGSLLTTIMAFLQAGINMALGVIIVYAIVQFTQTYILEPLVVGAKVNINPLCTIIVIIAGEMIWGVPGMVLALPVLGIAKIVFENIPTLQPFSFLIGEIKHKKPYVAI